MMMYEICAQTDPGLVRKNNEDAVAFDADTGVCLLADGMGGYNAGEVASSMAVTFINAEMSRWLAQAGVQATAKEICRAIEICVENANRSILDAAQANFNYQGMGTTLVVGVFQEHRLIVGHVGDSRCYRLRGQELLQITKDHSLLQEQIDAGLLTPRQSLTALNRNLITRALGVDGVQLETYEYRVEPGDTYLMCSDGLSDMVGDEDIAIILRNPRSTMEYKKLALLEAAKRGGGRDNISVVLIQAIEDSSRRGLLSRMLGK